jgi:3-hydroxyisobutyrate dehydrogenase-like beta-hydroxyacid dehydrogenase
MNGDELHVGIVGLGIMGSAIATNLAKTGKVIGYDIDQARAKAMAGGNLEIEASPAAVAKRADLLLTSLPSPKALDDVVSGANGLIASGRTGLVVAELSTLAGEDKERNRVALEKAGSILLDCPLSGTGAQAKSGDLSVYASGDAAAFERLKPVFARFSRSAYHIGAFGDGMKMKLVANLLVAIHNVATAEAMVLAEKSGLDLATVYKVIKDGAGQSRMFDVRGPQMVKGSYEPPTMKIDVWQKDMSLIGEFATEMSAPTPLFATTVPLYNAAMAQGLAKLDTAAVCAVLEHMAGIDRLSNPPGSKAD